MKENVIVSIIIPNFNGANYIGETLRSVICQSMSEWEAIVIDDGSSDNSVEIIRNMKDSRIKLLNRDANYPKGANSCRNIGINQARGEYLIFLDSDDLLEKNCLKKRVEYMRNNSNLDFAVFNMEDFMNYPGDGVLFTRLKNLDPLKHFIATDTLWQTTAVIWRKDFVKKIGGYNLEYQRLQDPEMTFRALVSSHGNYKLVYDSPADAFYRRFPKANRKKQRAQYKSLVKFIQDFYVIQNKKYINEINTFYIFIIISFHYLVCSERKDWSQYKNTIENLSEFCPQIESNILFRLNKYHTILKMIRSYPIINMCGIIYSKYINHYKEKYFNKI